MHLSTSNSVKTLGGSTDEENTENKSFFENAYNFFTIFE